jgi:prepilin-type N-terminal cleavage/methylation domain-containing protein
MNVDRMPKTNQRGFTIIELALAIVIMAIAMGAVALALGSTLRHGKNSTGRTVGAGIVTEEMETVRQLARTDFISLPLGLVERDTSIDGVTYHVLRESEFVSEASTEDVCSDTSSGRALIPITRQMRKRCCHLRSEHSIRPRDTSPCRCAVATQVEPAV